MWKLSLLVISLFICLILEVVSIAFPNWGTKIITNQSDPKKNCVITVGLWQECTQNTYYENQHKICEKSDFLKFGSVYCCFTLSWTLIIFIIASFTTPRFCSNISNDTKNRLIVYVLIFMGLTGCLGISIGAWFIYECNNNIRYRYYDYSIGWACELWLAVSIFLVILCLIFGCLKVKIAQSETRVSNITTDESIAESQPPIALGMVVFFVCSGFLFCCLFFFFFSLLDANV